MLKLRSTRGVLFILCPLILGFAVGVQNTGTAAEKDSSKGAFIEVAGPDIAYVPRTTTFVKHRGIVRKVVRFAAYPGDGEEECQCPKCCEGFCYVIVYTNLLGPGGPLRTLYILWLDC